MNQCLLCCAAYEQRCACASPISALVLLSLSAVDRLIFLVCPTACTMQNTNEKDKDKASASPKLKANDGKDSKKEESEKADAERKKADEKARSPDTAEKDRNNKAHAKVASPGRRAKVVSKYVSKYIKIIDKKLKKVRENSCLYVLGFAFRPAT